MRQMLKHQTWIVLVGLLVFFTNLGAAALFDMDEALYASCAREMAARGDWVVPWFNGQMFPDKPPLMFWLMMLGTQLFGATELAVRVHSAVLAIGTALATYHIGRLLFRAEVGLWAGLVVSTSIIFTVSARAATVDSALTFAITVAVWVFVADGVARGVKSPHPRPFPASGRGELLPRHWLGFVAVYALLGVAVLAKGPVGLVMPLAVLGLFLLMANAPAGLTEDERSRFQSASARWLGSLRTGLRLLLPPAATGWLWRLGPLGSLLRRFAPRHVLETAWQMRPLTAAIVVAAVALPWYVLVGLRTDGRWLHQFLAMYNVGPAVKAIQGHTGPWFYHLVVILIGFFPWSVFLGPTLLETARRIREGHPWRTGLILASCWAAAVIGLWSVVAMKLPHHVLPAYPALALLTGVFIHTWINQPGRIARFWVPNAAITFVVVGVGILVAMPFVAAAVLPGEGLLGLVGLPLVVGGAVCLVLTRRRKPWPTMVGFAATSVAFLVAMFGFAVLRVERHHPSPLLAAQLREAAGGPLELASFRYFRESFVYYSGGPVQRVHSAEDLDQFVRRSRRPLVITTDEHEASVRQTLGGPWTVLARQPKFLERGEIVVLAGPNCQGNPQLARRPTDGPQ